jgi:hypothetical protein
MNKQIEAIKLAIEVFDGNWHDEIVDTDWADKANNALTVLREALAAPSSTAGYAKKIESLIAERDALKSRLAEQPAPVYLGIRGGFAHDAQIKEKK